MIIALTGLKSSGKDYAGSIIKQYGYIQRAFADPVKNVIMNTFKIDSIEEYDDFKRKTHLISGKEVNGLDIVLNMGMAMRDVNPNFTIDYMNKWVDIDIVITDLRFRNEYDWCVDNKAVIVKIVAEDCDQIDHISEQGFSDHQCDYVIVNDKTPAFQQRVCDLMKILL